MRLVLALASLTLCGDAVLWCPRTAPGQEGVSHDEQVRRELAEIEKRYRRAEARGDREDILAEAAALALATPDAPPARVAEFLAEALSDEEPRIREVALRLLLKGQDPETVVEAILDGWKDAQKAWRSLKGDLKKLNDERGSTKPGGIGKQEFERMTRWPRYFECLITAMGLIPDERVEASLVKLLEEGPDDQPGLFFEAACRAAQSLGTAAAVEAEADLVARLGKALVRSRMKPFFPREGGLILMDVVLLPLEVAGEKCFDRIVEGFVAFAEAKATPPPPAPSLKQADQWPAWFEESASHFPSELGRLTKPIRVELVLPEPDDEE